MMTEVQPATIKGYNDESFRRIVARTVGKKVTVTKFHTDPDCNQLARIVPEDELGIEHVELTEREAELFGLSECAQCELRRTGGPSVQTIADFLRLMLADANHHPEYSTAPAVRQQELVTEMARRLVAVLGTHGYFIGRRA